MHFKILPWLLFHPHKINKRFNFRKCYVLLQQLSVVVQKRSDCFLRQNVVTNLFLHQRKLFRNVFLQMHKAFTLAVSCLSNTQMHRRQIKIKRSQHTAGFGELIQYNDKFVVESTVTIICPILNMLYLGGIDAIKAIQKQYN